MGVVITLSALFMQGWCKRHTSLIERRSKLAPYLPAPFLRITMKILFLLLLLTLLNCDESTTEVNSDTYIAKGDTLIQTNNNVEPQWKDTK
jgi:hypothetical protein